MRHGVAFFNRFRDMTASGFYSSAIGWRDVQYIGNVVQPGLRRLPARRTGEARRELRCHEDAREPSGEMKHDNDKPRASGSTRRLGIGFIGSGFNARFHMQAFRAVRDADVRGVWSPNAKNAAAAAALAHELDVGDGAARTRRSPTWSPIPAIDAIWLTGPNHARIENVEEIVDADASAAAATLARHRLREAAGAQRRRGEARARAGEAAPGSRTATSRTRSSRRRSRRGARSSGRAAPRRPGGPISPAPPRSTAGRTCPGSGAASCRAAACSTT